MRTTTVTTQEGLVLSIALLLLLSGLSCSNSSEVFLRVYPDAEGYLRTESFADPPTLGVYRFGTGPLGGIDWGYQLAPPLGEPIRADYFQVLVAQVQWDNLAECVYLKRDYDLKGNSTTWEDFVILTLAENHVIRILVSVLQRNSLLL